MMAEITNDLNIAGILARRDGRLERIERCLEPPQLREPQRPLDPNK
jgi:hypothetical protein